MSEQINTLVAEYNQAESAQSARRLQLFRLLEARNGYRTVRFAGKFGAWSNCWGWQERFAKTVFVDIMDQSITEVVQGVE